MNKEKYNLLVVEHKCKGSLGQNIGETEIWESNKQKLLEIWVGKNCPLTNTFQISVKFMFYQRCQANMDLN